jgi:hypothetical protein
MSDEERIKRVEEAIVIMKDLLLKHEDRIDGIQKVRKDDRENFDFKLNALIDSQIRSEAEIIEIKESLKELKEVSQSQLKRIENLENN